MPPNPDQSRHDHATLIRFARSADAGNSWSEPRTLAHSETPSDHPFLLTHGRRLFLSWYARDTGYRLIPVP